jgi:hypothetical protein
LFSHALDLLLVPDSSLQYKSNLKYIMNLPSSRCLFSGNKFQPCLSLSGDECVVVIRGAFREELSALFSFPNFTGFF